MQAIPAVCARCGLARSSNSNYPGCRADNFRSACVRQWPEPENLFDRLANRLDGPVSASFSGTAATTVIATVALLPFVQAVVSTLGTRLGEALDNKARATVRTLLERWGRIQNERSPESQPGTFGIVMTPQASQALVRITSDLPAEAIVQLAAMQFHDLAVPENGQVTVRWVGDQWLASLLQDGVLTDRTWNADHRSWSQPRTTESEVARNRDGSCETVSTDSPTR